MQTRDYDDYLYIPSTLGFRKVDDAGTTIDNKKETDGYCNLYANSISVSYLHNMRDAQINAIHFFEEHHDTIFLQILLYLEKEYSNPLLQLGFRHVNILEKEKDTCCYTEYVFIDVNEKKITLTLHKQEVVEKP